MGHQGSIERKIKSIEYLDGRVIGRIRKQLDEYGERYRMLVLPDHPTPISCRTHTSTPVPYMLYDSGHEHRGINVYNEKTAAASEIFVPEGYKLIDRLFTVPEV